MGQAQSSLMAKVAPIALPGSSAAGGWKGGSLGVVGPGDSVRKPFPLNPKPVANVFPRMWKDGEVQFMLGWAGARSSLGKELFLRPGSHHSLPLKQYHSASENKICIHVTPP